MTRSLSNPGMCLLFGLLVATTACTRTDAGVTGPATVVQTSSVRSSLGVEPSSVQPEFLPGGSCAGRPAFGARVGVVVRGNDVILRDLRFSFTDRFGATTRPRVIPIPSLSTPIPPPSTLPAGSPVPIPGIAPLPGASPIPIPGASPINGLFFAAGTSRVLPFAVLFDCGVFPAGSLIIAADAGDRSGRFSTSELRVRIGS